MEETTDYKPTIAEDPIPKVIVLFLLRSNYFKGRYESGGGFPYSQSNLQFPFARFCLKRKISLNLFNNYKVQLKPLQNGVTIVQYTQDTII